MNGDTKFIPPLSQREAEVMHLIAQGYNNRAIAERLSVEPKTIERHVASVFSKLPWDDEGDRRVQAVLVYQRGVVK